MLRRRGRGRMKLRRQTTSFECVVAIGDWGEDMEIVKKVRVLISSITLWNSYFLDYEKVGHCTLGNLSR